MASDDSLVQAARILARAMADKVPFQDLEQVSDLKSSALYQRLLGVYADEVMNASVVDLRLWMLRRLASIESRLMAVEASLLQHSNSSIVTDFEPEDVFAITRSQKTFPADLKLAVDDTIVQTGFYPSERSKSGPTFRWIGPEPRARIFLVRIEGPLEVTLAVPHSYLGAATDEVKISLDEGPWTAGNVVEQDGITLLSFRPKHGSKRFLQTMQLDIDAVRTVSPKQKGKSDSRPLSIAISSVEIRPLGGTPRS